MDVTSSGSGTSAGAQHGSEAEAGEPGERIRFTVSAGTAVKIGFFASLGVIGLLLLVSVMLAVAALVLAAGGFVDLPALPG